MSKILITGASGFIGRRLTSYLESRGKSLILISNKSKVDNSFSLDLINNSIPQKLFQGVDSVIHLAGKAHDLGKSKSLEYRQLNYEATLRIANSAYNAGVKHFIFVSSAKANICQNDFITSSFDTYGTSKRKAEIELIKKYNTTEMIVSVARPSLVYGPELKGNLRSMIKALKVRLFPLLPNLDNKKSMVHIDDLVIAIVFLMENNESHGKIFGITDGKTYSSDQILNTLINIHNAKNPLWKVSKPILMFLSGDSGIRKKFQKILEDDLVDDEEISNLGFKAQFSLENLYEKIF